MIQDAAVTEAKLSFTPGDITGVTAGTGMTGGGTTGEVSVSFNSGWGDGRYLNETQSFSGDVTGTYNNTQVANDSHSHSDASISDTISIDNGRLYAPDGSGNVGIGTTSPVQKLDVSGTVRMTGFSLPTGASNGYVLTSNSSGVGTWQEASGGSSGWELTGNSGTSPGTNFVGTTDNKALELRTNNQRAIRIEPDNVSYPARSPNVICGYENNSVSSGVRGATISGGGNYDYPTEELNRVTEDFGTVGGGRANTAGDDCATVGGGDGNSANGDRSTIAGGMDNITSSTYSTVGGGGINNATGSSATVAGGWSNDATGHYAAVGGGEDNVANNMFSTVAGGRYNTAGTSWGATVGGGMDNTASNFGATVPGGEDNTAAGRYSLAAGYRAKANHQGSFVWGDSTNADFSSSDEDQFLIRASNGVGIGKTNPAYALDVNGDIGCVALHESSDRRLKSKIVPIENALARIEKLRGVSFEWNRNAKALGAAVGEPQIGVIAQEVEAVFPEIVAVPENGYRSVDYSKLTAVLIEAVKELKSENLALQERVAALEREAE